tara:strand:+ start:364 stop:738 length:375 start_codon:yes stop_codon:yes gene_type:complete
MMNELLDKLKSDPPQNEEELTQLLGETGYDLVPTEPMAAKGGDMGDDMDDSDMGDMSEKKGDDKEEEMDMDMEEEEADMPPPMKMPGKGAPTRVELSVMRLGAAKKALDKGKKNKKMMKGGMYG